MKKIPTIIVLICGLLCTNMQNTVRDDYYYLRVSWKIIIIIIINILTLHLK